MAVILDPSNPDEQYREYVLFQVYKEFSAFAARSNFSTAHARVRPLKKGKVLDIRSIK
jgi:hypothetical protein